MSISRTISLFLPMVLLCAVSSLRADDFTSTIQPLIKQHCLKCHSTAEKQGELDLQRFSSLVEVKRQPAIWQKVQEQLALGEMPPKDEPPLPSDQRKQLLGWIEKTLREVALAQAGDPGPVVLRRLSNSEYTYTVRDLTGVATLDPAQEFPADGAAGEGFTNAGAALVMSPSLLTKYLDAGKEIAAHAVLLPDGIRFSPSTTPRDWTDETLARIRGVYSRHSATGGGTAVNLQGIKFDTNAGGRLPVERYITALVQERDALMAHKKQLAIVAAAHKLNEKYLTALWKMLSPSPAEQQPSLLLDNLRAQFAQATPDDAPAIVRFINDWQQSLWRFASVGHIGKLNGPKGWQEPVTPLTTQQELKLKLPPPDASGDVTVYLWTGDAGDGREQDVALWQNPRIVAPGRPDLPLRSVRAAAAQLAERREQVIATTARCLAAASEADLAKDPPVIAVLAEKHRVDSQVLTAWLDYLKINSAGEVRLGPLLTKKQERHPDYAFIQGWVGGDALSVVANSSDATVRIPGQMKPHSVAVHPSPKLEVFVAWRSPISGSLKVNGVVQSAHPECGNGISWSLEVRRGQVVDRLASGVSQRAMPVPVGPFENVRLRSGDVVALVISPREGNHSCDLTAIDLTLDDGRRQWNLAQEISPNILAGNPHADSHGNADVWHFGSQSITSDGPADIPTGSLLAAWRSTIDAAERQQIAEKMQSLLKKNADTIAKELPDAKNPDRQLYERLLSFQGPLLVKAMRLDEPPSDDVNNRQASSIYGLAPTLFGKQPQGQVIDAQHLCVQAPSLLEVRLPAALAAGAEMVVTGKLAPGAGPQASVQMQLLPAKPADSQGLVAGKTETANLKAKWSDNNLQSNSSSPVIVADGSSARPRFEAAFADLRQYFPTALCYTKIVPVDEVVTLTLFYREDDQLRRLMLDDDEARELDRLWDELQLVSEAPLKQVDVFEQLYQFATQDANPSAFEPLRAPTLAKAAAFKQRVIDVEPLQLQAVLDLAPLAWRRPLVASEAAELRSLYQQLRGQKLAHEATLRMLIARVFVAPAFLYRGEHAAPGGKSSPVNDWELATRLSYFLWSTTPDDELRALATSGKLHEPSVLQAQAERMLKDERVRRLALEFGCQWLHVRDLDTLDEKSERHFPTFAALRGLMQEETVRLFADLFAQDRSVLSLLDADHTFVNSSLAQHYDIKNVKLTGDEWQRVDGQRSRGRGGILGLASTLARQSGASRTSPILRGNWISEVLLGDKLPKPPKGVPVLPEEAPAGLTERQLIERHSSDAKCASCHQRIDPLGFALEGFDAIGRARQTDAAGLPIEAKTRLPDGTAINGLEGLRTYLLMARRDDFVRQFCRKLLGYALGRGVQLSDQPLIEEMLADLKSHDYRVSRAVMLIVSSPQFRMVRGRDVVEE